MIELSLLLVGLIVALGLAVYVGHVWQGKRHPSAPPEHTPQAENKPVAGGCCGQHAVCERESLLAGVSPKVVYYDDEELDNYQHTPSDQYTDEQIETFREVLYTMRTDEVPGWVRSLQLRKIELPDALKDEIVLLVREIRNQP